MSKKIISKMSLKTIALATAVTVCGVFCFDYIIGNEALAFDAEKGGFADCCTGGGNGPSIGGDGDSDTGGDKK